VNERNARRKKERLQKGRKLGKREGKTPDRKRRKK